MTAGLSVYAFGIGVANAGLVRLTLFASEMSKGTVSAAMGMLQMLIFTVGNRGEQTRLRIWRQRSVQPV